MAEGFHIRHLLMDLDTAALSQQIIDSNVRMMIADLDSVKFTMEELRGTWVGDAALEYFTTFDSMFASIQDFVGRWKLMSDVFAQEIPAWDEMSRHLAGTP